MIKDFISAFKIKILDVVDALGEYLERFLDQYECILNLFIDMRL